MAWTRYDIWDPWIVKKTSIQKRWAVVNTQDYAPLYITPSRTDARRHVTAGHIIIEYVGFAPNGMQEMKK